MGPNIPGSVTPRPKTISARDSSARTFRPIFQSETARPTLVWKTGNHSKYVILLKYRDYYYSYYYHYYYYCSAHFILYIFFFYFIYLFLGDGQCIVLFCLCASKQDSRNFIKRDSNFQTRKWENNMSHVMRKSFFEISEHTEMSKIHVKSFFLLTR